MEFKLMHKKIPYKITIKQVSNGGFKCKVGCETFVYTNCEAGITALLSDLRNLLEAPEAIIKQYRHELVYWTRHNQPPEKGD